MLEHIVHPPPADTDEEYRAATTGAALFDHSDFAKILVTGPDAPMFLGNLSTNDIKNIPLGGGCESYFCDPRGKVLFQTWMYHLRLGVHPHVICVETLPGRGEALFKHLDRYLISEAVELNDATTEFAQYFLSGPAAARVLQSALGTALPELVEFQHVESTFGSNSKASIRRHDWLGAPGYDIVCTKANDEAVWQMLTAAGATPASEETWNVLRIEAGRPIFGPDIDENRFVMEVGDAERAVSYTKGCYLGQEPIVMARDRAGHAPRSFVQVKLPEDVVVVPGAKVLAGSDEIGSITSSCVSPKWHSSVALGYVRWKHREPGTVVNVETESGLAAGEVMKR